MKLSRSFIAFIIIGLTACGQKGPLYMPDLEKLSNQSSGKLPSNSQAGKDQEAQQKEQKDEAVSEPSGSQ